jgi:ComF family protein
MFDELIAPNICVICGRPCVFMSAYPCFCHFFLQKLPWRFNRTQINMTDELDKDFFTKCDRPFYASARIPRLLAACDYEGRLRRCLIELKFYGKTGMADPLAAILVSVIRSRKIQIDVVSAVPLHHKRLRERGYNQAGLLADRVAKSYGCPDISDLLIRCKNTQRQSEQHSRRARFENLASAFAIDEEKCYRGKRFLAGRRVLLIDDVMTTGATLLAAADPLVEAGADVVCIAVASDHK